MAVACFKISRRRLLQKNNVFRIGCVLLVVYVGVQQSFSFSSSSSFYDTSKLFRLNPVAHEYSRTSSDKAVPGVGLGVLEETARYHGTLSLKGSGNGGLSYYESPDYKTIPEFRAALGPRIDFHSSELAYDGHPPSRARFVGMLRQLVHSGKNAFEKDELEHSGSSPVLNEAGAVSFLSSEAYLTTQVMMSTTFSISFKMKTVHRDGLILYGVMVGKAYLAVEMSSGHMRYVYNINGLGSHLLRTKSRHPINDNQWHDVAIFWNSVTEHVLQIDNLTAVNDVLSESELFELHGELYIGGVSHQLYSQLPKKIQSSHGFQGCLSSFRLEGSEHHLLDEKFISIPDEYRYLIKRGCGEPMISCTQTSCENGGECVQGIEDFFCVCNMTSFTGPTCSDDSIAYGFGERGGVIRFRFPDNAPPNTKQDLVAFGISTLQSDAVLLRITSVNFKDLIEIELSDGFVSAKYNLGFANHHLGETNRRINDDIYHVVRFSRLGASATLQIDDHPVNSYAPVGHQLNVFDRQSEIEVGARRNLSEGRYDFLQPFQGTVVGLVVNGIRVLDLAAEGDKRITIEGDVDLDTKPLKLFQSFPQLLPPGFSIYEDSTIRQFLGNSSGNEDHDKDEDVEDNSVKASQEEEQEAAVDDLIFSGRDRFECRYEVPCQMVTLKSDAFILPVLNRHVIRQSESKEALKKSNKSEKPNIKLWSPMLSTVKPSVSFGTSSQKWTHEKTGFGGAGGSRAIPCDPSDMVTCRMVADRASTSQQMFTKLQQHISVTAENRSSTLLQSASSEQISMLANVFLSPLSSTSEESLARNNATSHHNRHKESFSVTYDSTPTTEMDFQRVRGSKELETIPLNMNIGLMSGIAISVCILIFMLVYAVCKSCRLCRHSGVTLHESKNYEKKISDDHKLDETNGLLRTSVTFPRQRDVREWYV